MCEELPIELWQLIIEYILPLLSVSFDAEDIHDKCARYSTMDDSILLGVGQLVKLSDRVLSLTQEVAILSQVSKSMYIAARYMITSVNLSNYTCLYTSCSLWQLTTRLRRLTYFPRLVDWNFFSCESRRPIKIHPSATSLQLKNSNLDIDTACTSSLVKVHIADQVSNVCHPERLAMFATMRNVRHLKIDDCAWLTNAVIATFPEVMWKGMQTLTLGSPTTTELTDAEMIRVIVLARMLTTLDLQGCYKLTSLFFQHLCDHPTRLFESLDFFGCTGLDVNACAFLLTYCNKLTYFDAQETNLNRRDITFLTSHVGESDQMICYFDDILSPSSEF